MDTVFQSMVNKYKPKTFSQTFGLDGISKTFNSIVTSKRFNSILLLGLNGHGKTMIADLLMARLFCQAPSGLDACLRCDNCQRINNATIISDVYKTTGEKLNPTVMKELEYWCNFVPRYLPRRAIFIDDFDLAPRDMGRLLKGIIDNYGDDIIVILTATVQGDVFLPLIQRCKVVPVLKLSHDSLDAMIKSICSYEGIQIDIQESVDQLIYLSAHTPRIILRALEAIADLDEGLSSASLQSPFVKSNLQDITGQY